MNANIAAATPRITVPGVVKSHIGSAAAASSMASTWASVLSQTTDALPKRWSGPGAPVPNKPLASTRCAVRETLIWGTCGGSAGSLGGFADSVLRWVAGLGRSAPNAARGRERERNNSNSKTRTQRRITRRIIIWRRRRRRFITMN